MEGEASMLITIINICWREREGERERENEQGNEWEREEERELSLSHGKEWATKPELEEGKERGGKKKTKKKTWGWRKKRGNERRRKNKHLKKESSDCEKEGTRERGRGRKWERESARWFLDLLCLLGAPSRAGGTADCSPPATSTPTGRTQPHTPGGRSSTAWRIIRLWSWTTPKPATLGTNGITTTTSVPAGDRSSLSFCLSVSVSLSPSLGIAPSFSAHKHAHHNRTL